ncbi:MAG: hypothetical protein E6274_06410 [Clostridium sp.]|uniref:hypothetical protein n=1 Tax=Clostridium sp. TaxID=1506 RepID=UPI002913954D|nr:hypothetical protein [Clostridium sp.]MDU7251950.1 hypothetical protein [Clostridium sp.]
MTFDNKWRVDKKMFSKTYLDIVSDASITSAHIANGKNIPLIILDTTNYQDIEQAILFHASVEHGRVSTIWGKSVNNNVVTLSITLINPVPVEFVVAFDVQKQGGLIDLIINSQLLYIQPGKPKDRLYNTMNAQRLIIEVPSTHFVNQWEKQFTKVMTKYFRKKGLSKKAAKNATIDLHNEWGIMRNFRIK